MCAWSREAHDLQQSLIAGAIDVVLLADVHADDLAAVTEQLKGADSAVRVLVVAGECGPEYLAATAAARVDGLLSGDADLGDVLAAIRSIRNDTGLLVDQRLLAALVSATRLRVECLVRVDRRSPGPPRSHVARARGPPPAR